MVKSRESRLIMLSRDDGNKQASNIPLYADCRGESILRSTVVYTIITRVVDVVPSIHQVHQVGTFNDTSTSMRV